MQCGVDVLGHAGGVAADVEVGARFQPGEEFGGVFLHPVLDVDLCRLVAGEGDIRGGPRQPAVCQRVQLLPVEEVAGGLLVAEEEPVLAVGAGGVAFLEEGAEGGDAGARSTMIIGWSPFAGGRKALFEWTNTPTLPAASARSSESDGAYAFARPAVLVVPYRADGKVHPGRDGPWVRKRSSRVAAGSSSSLATNSAGSGLGGGRKQQVNDVVRHGA